MRSASFRITGTARGFGRLWTETALKRDDKVISAAREPLKLNNFTTDFGDDIFRLS